MSREALEGEPHSDDPTSPSEALAAPDPEVALRHAAVMWAEQNTRPETLARAEKLRDKVTAVTSFFDFVDKHPGEVTPDDVSRWRAESGGAVAEARDRLRACLKGLGLLPLADV